MKWITLLIPLFAWGSPLFAQTNGTETVETTNGVAVTRSEPAEVAEPAEETTEPCESLSKETHIFSDSVELGIRSRSAIYRGNVRLEDPRLHLTCEQLSADVPEEGGRVQKVVAETNVVIVLVDEEGKTNRAYAERAVYSYTVTEYGTNELVELSGVEQPRIEREKSILYGDRIVWDRMKDQITAVNQRMVYRPEPKESEAALTSTNTPAEVGQGGMDEGDESDASTTDE